MEKIKPIYLGDKKLKTQKDILYYLIQSENSLESLLDKSNQSVMISLHNMRVSALSNENIPEINEKLYAELLDTITLNKKKTLTTTYNDKLKTIALTQENIYKVLKRIEEDLIDEQDTRIKNSDRKDGKTVSEGTGNNTVVLLGDIPEGARGSDIADLLTSLGVKVAGSYIGKKIAEYRANKSANKETKTNKENKEAKTNKETKETKTNKETKQTNKVNKSGKVGKTLKFMGKALVVLDLALFLHDLYKYYNEAEKSIDNPGVIEQSLYAFASATTKYIEGHLDLIEVITKYTKKFFEFVESNLSEIINTDQTLNDSTTKEYIGYVLMLFSAVPVKLASTFVDFSEVITNLIRDLRSIGAFGSEAGLQAVQLYRELKDRLVFNFPNKATFKILIGSDENLNNAQKYGYTWHMWGESTLYGDYKLIAKTYTTSELLSMKEHDDVSEEDKKRIEQAIKAKDDHEYSDAVIEQLRQRQTKLEPLINSLSINNTDFGKLWYEFVTKSNGVIRTSPVSCIIEGHYRDNKFETYILPNVLAGNDITDSQDKAKLLIDSMLTQIKKAGYNMTDEGSNTCYYFTVYGTVVKTFWINDVVKFKNFVNSGMRNPDLKTTKWAQIVKVVGYFNVDTMKITDKKVAPNDIVFDENFKYNIITSSELNQNTSVKSYNISVDSDVSNSVKFSTNVAPSTNAVQALPSVKVKQGDVAKRVNEFLTEMGFTKEQVAGIMGNMMQESSMNPNAVNNSGGGRGAHGLCQWRGPRLTALEKLAESQGKSIYDLDVQLEFLKQELLSTHKKAYKALKNSTTVEEASLAWSSEFERAGKGAHDAKRIQYAMSYYNDAEPSTASTPAIQSSGVQSSQSSGYSQQNSGATTTAADYARSHAKGRSVGRCARYVANALQASGFKFQRQPSAYMYHTNGVLSKMGFNLVHSGLSGFKPQKGDVCVINRFGKHVHGHICIYDGRNWISDFVQRNASPYKDGAPNGAWFYRYGSGTLDVSDATNDVSTQNRVDDYNYNDVGNNSYPSQDLYVSKTDEKTTTSSTVISTNTTNKEEVVEYEGMCESLFYIKV